MSHLPDDFIICMKDILVNAELIEKRIPRHKYIQESVFDLFNWFKFRTKKEYLITYERRYRSRARYGEIKSKANGYVDIYAKMKNCIVAFEYDNISKIKWKSIEKLLQSNALYCFGIAYGPQNKNNSQIYEENLKKIQQVYKEVISNYNESKSYDRLYFLLKKELWLGIIRLGIFEKINLKNLMNIKF